MTTATRRRSPALLVVLTMLLSVLPTAGLLTLGASAAQAATCPCSLWSNATTPTTPDSGDAKAVEVGVQFSSATSGFISGVRFYKAAANTGIHVGSLWSTSGTLLAQATFSDETGSGWQQVTFAHAVAITANTTYVASYHASHGHYSGDEGYFTTSGFTNDPLTAPGGDPSTPNGLFTYSDTPTFPTGTFNGTNYWVDVVYTPVAPTPPGPATSLWGTHATPATIDSGDPRAVEVGVQFASATNGFVTGVRFYKADANTGTHIGSLWSTTGSLLAQATFTSESANGWQQVTFAQPVAITAGTTYVASYHSDTGHYSVDDGYFSSGSYVNPPLTAPGGDPSAPNGLFVYAPTPTFPTDTFNGSNYWVDVTLSSAPTPVSVSVSAPQAALPRGTSEQLTATETLSDGSTVDVTSTATWSSSSANVAVSSTGVASAVKQGPATVTATAAGLSGQVALTVRAPVLFFVVDPTVLLLTTGQSRQLNAVAVLTDGSRLSITPLATWGTLVSTGGLTVGRGGLVTATRPSVTIVSASLGRMAAVALVAVVPPLPGRS